MIDFHVVNAKLRIDLFDGMTLRDYFAGQALANLNLQAHVATPAAKQIATSAYEIADAMLGHRNGCDVWEPTK